MASFNDISLTENKAKNIIDVDSLNDFQIENTSMDLTVQNIISSFYEIRLDNYSSH